MAGLPDFSASRLIREAPIAAGGCPTLARPRYFEGEGEALVQL
jgi:hypothetical protein